MLELNNLTMSKSKISNKLKPEIGKIVSLKTHYIRGASEILDQIYIAGDDKSIPPFMMITEFILETKDRFDEDTGGEILGSDSHHCKVQWFNTKMYEVSETWINSDFLEEVIVEGRKKETSTFSKGDCVILKTNELEIKKKRTSLKIEESTVNLKASSVVSFCAPEMIVMSRVAFKVKQPIIDKNTGKQTRFNPKFLIKFKYYNPLTNKYSEGLLPKECFEKADTEIESLDETLDSNSVVLYKKKLLQVKNISYLHGVYMAYCKNFVDGSEESFRMNELRPLELFDKKELIKNKLAPTWRNGKFESISFYIQKKQKSREKLEEMFDKGEEGRDNFRPIFTNGYFFIEYRNLKGKYTERFIKILETSEFLIKEGRKRKEDEEIFVEQDTKGLMVQAYCFLRSEVRTFTFTDDRLLAIYDVDETNSLDKDTHLNLKKVLEASQKSFPQPHSTI